MVLSMEKFFRNFHYFNPGNYNLLLSYLSYPFRNAINIANDVDSSASPHMCVPCVCTVFSFEQLHRCEKTHNNQPLLLSFISPPSLHSVSANVLLCIRPFPGNPRQTMLLKRSLPCRKRCLQSHQQQVPHVILHQVDNPPHVVSSLEGHVLPSRLLHSPHLVPTTC